MPDIKKRCPNCNRKLTLRNNLNKKLEICQICIEEILHKQKIDYLKGKISPIFVCGEDGCKIQSL